MGTGRKPSTIMQYDHASESLSCIIIMMMVVVVTIEELLVIVPLL
jgi:hypothetical protein